jgi:hypothetical protein
MHNVRVDVRVQSALVVNREILLAAVICVLIGGCGSQTYDRRLNKTIDYFGYLEKQRVNLSRSAWKGAGVELRVPRQFRVVPGPKAPSEGTTTPAPVDGRQPTYMNGPLPGLIGAWRAKVRVTGEPGVLPCDLFVLSNHELFAQDKGDEASEFLNTAVFQIFEGLGTPMPEVSRWKKEQIPVQPGYVKKKVLTKYQGPLSQQIQGVDMDAAIYLTQSGDTRIIILFVVPRRVSAKENLHDRIPMCLESLVLSTNRPGKAGETKKKVSPAF